MTTESDRLVELAERLRAFYRDVGDRDGGGHERALELFAEDARIQGAGTEPIVGADAIRRWWRGVVDAMVFEVDAEIDEVRALGDHAMLRGRAVGVMTPRGGGDPTSIDTWFVQVYRPDQEGVLRFWRGANGPNPS